MRASLIQFCLVLVIFLPACQTLPPAEVASGSATDGVFIHISHGSEDSHRVLMGLRMAAMMSEDKDVLVYFDVKGVEVVLSETNDMALPGMETVTSQLQALSDRGVPLYVCPSCMKIAGKSEADLIRGVKMAEKEAFFSFTKGRILSLDY